VNANFYEGGQGETHPNVLPITARFAVRSYAGLNAGTIEKDWAAVEVGDAVIGAHYPHPNLPPARGKGFHANALSCLDLT
jgi:hypothetical protein